MQRLRALRIPVGVAGRQPGHAGGQAGSVSAALHPDDIPEVGVGNDSGRQRKLPVPLRTELGNISAPDGKGDVRRNYDALFPGAPRMNRRLPFRLRRSRFDFLCRQTLSELRHQRPDVGFRAPGDAEHHFVRVHAAVQLPGQEIPEGGPIPVLFLLLHPLVVGQSVGTFIYHTGTGEHGRQPTQSQGMPRHGHLLLHITSVLFQQIPNRLFIQQLGFPQYFRHQGHCRFQILRQGAEGGDQLRFIGCSVVVLRERCRAKINISAVQTAPVQQIRRGGPAGGNFAQNLRQEGNPGQLFFCPVRNVKERRYVQDAAGWDIVHQHLGAVHVPHLRRDVLRHVLNICQSQVRQALQILLRIRLLLPFLQFSFLTLKGFLLRRIPGCFLVPKPLLLCLSPFFACSAGRFHDDLAAVVVVQINRPKEFLEVSLVGFLPKLLENISHLQVGLRLSTVQPALQDVETVD